MLIHLLRKILNETPYLSVIASRSNSAQELANIDKLIKITTSFSPARVLIHFTIMFII